VGRLPPLLVALCPPEEESDQVETGSLFESPVIASAFHQPTRLDRSVGSHARVAAGQ